MSTTIEKLFMEEVRDKKRTASGVHSKTGKRGYIGKMQFPSDIMSRKDRKEYIKSGEVIVTNIYDKIMPREEFQAHSEEEQKVILQALRERHKTKDIQKAWRMNSAGYYALVDKFGLAKLHRGGRRAVTPKTKTNTPVIVELQEAPIVRDSAPIRADGMCLEFNGQHKADLIISRLEKLLLVLSDEEGNFDIQFRVRELAQ